MEDDTTTTQPTDDAGAQAPPVEPVVTDVADETTTTEPSEPSSDAAEETPSAPTADDKLQKFARSQGIDLDSPSAIKAAQIAMKAQSEATRNYQKSQELEKATNINPEQVPADATPQQHENVRLRNMELKMDIQSWKLQNQDKLALESQMVEVLSDPNKKLLVQEGYLTLDDVYNLAKANSPDNSAEVKSQGKREALQSLAQKQQAAVPTGHATNPSATPKEKPFKELSLEEMRAKLGYARR